MDDQRAATLVTGASGFLGSLVSAALLAEGNRRVLIPVRSGVTPESCLARIRLALLDGGVTDEATAHLMRFAIVAELPHLDNLQALDSVVAAMKVDEVVHCAGSVDYWDKSALQLANVEFTSRLLSAARNWQVQRFIYISTAYCSGYQSGTIAECLHPDPVPADEPTEYTRSKRQAEWRIADSGIPFIIIRPSVIIGDSRTGIYRGKNYGLYQMWRAIEGLLCREYSPIWYTVAPEVPVNFVHQDAFWNAFIGIYRTIGDNEIVHLVADEQKSPTMRQLCWLWANVYFPLEIHCYDRVDDVPLRSIPIRQRRFLELAGKNFEIATQGWKFETRHLEALKLTGLRFTDATLGTVACCQTRYIEGSPRIQEHSRRFASTDGTRLVDLGARICDGTST